MNRAQFLSILAVAALAGCASRSDGNTRYGGTSRGSADGMYSSSMRDSSRYGSSSYGDSYRYSDSRGIRHDWRPEWGTRSGTDICVTGGNTYGSSTYTTMTSDGRYWDGQYWRTSDGRWYDGQTWRYGTPYSASTSTTYYGSSSTTTAPYPQSSSPSTYVNTDNVIDVAAEAFPTRTYFFEPTDTTHVYWFDPLYPNAWSYRPYYREGDRTYFIERDGTSLRRIWFDDRRARDFDWSRDSRWTETQREEMRNAARQEWTQRERTESTWRNRWEQQHRNQMNQMR